MSFYTCTLCWAGTGPDPATFKGSWGLHVKKKKIVCQSAPTRQGWEVTFCQSMMRMMREMTVRTTKARMAEITTTLKGRAGGRDKELAISKRGAWQLPGSPPVPPPLVRQILSTVLPGREAPLHQPWPVMSDSQPLPQGHTSHKNLYAPQLQRRSAPSGPPYAFSPCRAQSGLCAVAPDWMPAADRLGCPRP